MADIDIVVDSGDLKAAIDLLKDYGISFTKMVNQVQTEGNRLSRASKATAAQVEQAWENAQKVLNNNKLEQEAAKEKATLDKRAAAWKQYFNQVYMQNQGTGITKQNSALVQMLKDEEEASKLAQKATRELEAEKRRLTAAYNPLAAAEQQYIAAKNQIARASELGVLNAKQEAAALDNLEREYQALSKGVYLAGSRFNQFGEQSGIAGKSANRFGMYAQQAGYQLGDFAVQIQSGTNVGVAFSQQFAQLAGLIPGVAGAVTTFAAIGLGLLIQNLTRGKEEAAKLDDVVSDFEKFDDIFKSAGVSLEDNFITAIEKVREKYGELIADISKTTTEGALSKLTAALGKEFKPGTITDPNNTKGFFGEFLSAQSLFGGVGPYGSLVLTGPQQEAIKQMEEYNEVATKLRDRIKELGEQGYTTMEQFALGVDEFFTEVKVNGEYSEEAIKRVMSTLEKAGLGEAIARVKQEREEQLKTALELKATLQQEIEMRNLILRYGEDSVQVKQAELDAEHAKTLAMIEGLDVADSLKAELEAAAKANYDAESATISWGNSLGYVKNQIAGIAAILASIGGGMISNAEKFTTAKLIREGKTRVEAEKLSRYQTEDARYEAQKQQNLAQYGKIVGTAINAALSVDHVGGRNADEALLSAYELDAERTKAEREANKKGRKKGGRGKLSDAEKDAKKAQEKLEDFFDQFKLGMEQQERLLGVYGEQREELEKVIEIENRLGDARHLVSQKQIEAMAQEELALERKLEREQQIYELGRSSFENFLMTVVDGTSSIEDAFKAMLANIIREVYQQYVAKGAADVAGNFLVSLFSAKGNAFGSGGVKMFANGGVVDSPTLFNYSGGTGMMGEAGPEAIMPLKRNSQGKLGVQVSGGGQSVVVNNHWYISANGDAAVKAIIQSEAPKIIEKTKLAVADANRRNRRGFN